MSRTALCHASHLPAAPALGRMGRCLLNVTLLTGLALAGCGKQSPPATGAADPEPVVEGKPRPADPPGSPPAEDTTEGVPRPPDVPPRAEAKLRPIVFLESADPPAPAQGRVHSVLLRELVRQAFLIAARESMGLTTRDGALGEFLPDELSREHRLRLTTSFEVKAPVSIAVQSGPETDRKTLWSKDADPIRGQPEDLTQVLATAEVLSRTDFVTALTAAGYQGKPSPARRDVPLPAQAEKLLGEMAYPAQFQAVRDLHAALRSQGESPALVAALARAYANLGVLTECHWSPSHKVYKARALLYAQRLIAAEPKSPRGYWHRAYAAGLAGLHRVALDDINRGLSLGKEQGPDAPAGPPAQQPAWAGLIQAFCRFDAARLQAAAKNPRHAQLAQLLHFLAVESKVSVHFTLEAARQALRDNPECFRIHDSIADLGGPSVRQRTTVDGMEVFARTFPQRMAAMRGLPDTVAGLLQANEPERDVVSALVSAGRSAADTTEPSWTILGRWAQDARFLQVARRLYTMHYQQVVPVDAFLKEARPLVAGHPLEAYVESFGLDRRRQRAEYVSLIAKLPLADLDVRAQGILQAISETDPPRWKQVATQALQNCDNICYDRSLLTGWTALSPKGRATWARILLAISPHAPAAQATLIAEDWDFAKQRVEAWEKGPSHPAVFLALGRRYTALKQTEDAERCLKRCVALSPDLVAYRSLAEVYRAAEKPEQWLATLEEFLQREDTGPDHAQARVDIARHFMRQKDFKRALPYAEAAAQTKAEWALRCIGECHEGLGDWAKAELALRQVSERYRNLSSAWFYWCKRTGKGDLKAAQAFLEKDLERIGPQPGSADHVTVGGYQYLTGPPKEALEAFREASRDSRLTWVAPLLAALLDELGDAAERDKVWQAIPATNPYKPLTDLFSATLAKGEGATLDVSAAEAIRKELPPLNRPAASFFIGRFLEQRGQTEAAREYLQRCVAEAEPKDALLPTLASVRLRTPAGK